MATGGLYGQSPTGALIAQPGTETTGLYGKSPNGSVIAQPGSESSGLYGGSPNFGGTYFEWFVFQVAAEQPATPTGGSWSFTTNTGTPPSGWSNAPAEAPTNPVWISIGLVNSRSTSEIVWSTPGVFSYSGQLNGSGAPTSGIGLDGEFYIQTGVSPYAIWYKNSGTWSQVTGSAIYVALTGDQTIGGTKTFSSLIQGSISGNAATATTATSATTATYATSAGSAATATDADHATNADFVPYSGLTGTVPTWNQNTTGNAATADYATNAGYATNANSAVVAGNVTGVVAIANGGTGASDATTARTNLGLGSAAVLTAGAALGVATLDAGGTVPLSQIPASIQGGVSYQGTWNATTNSPTLTSSVGTKGYYYVVSVAGSTNLNGITTWNIGDWAIFNGTTWEKIDNTDAVTSVNGYTGTVVLNANDVGALSDITSTDGSVAITTPSTGVRDLSVAVAGATTNVICLVRNTTGATLTKGTVVYISGATGQNPTVSKALATSDATSAQTLGMMTADLANNSNGYVTVIGLITNIDTSAYTDGQQLYLSGTTAGTVTGTKPYAPIHLVYVAVVEHAHPTQGKLFVKVQNGYELDEIHNVSAQTPTTGQTIVYNSSTQLWEQSNAPVISGTTIDSTVIGGTTPAAGTFTTLTATGQTSLGGATGAESLRVLTPSVVGSRLDIQSFSGSTQLSGEASSGVVDVVLNSRSSGSVRFRTAGGTEQARVSHTASAVNYVQVTGSATLTGGPTLSAQGSDFNIPLRLQAKGISAVELGNPAGWAGFTVTTTNNPNRIALNAPATGFIPTFTTAGVDTNAGMAFISKGTGAIDLAAGSSGVNISNGGTVTAITRTSGGTGYTSVPTMAISAPTTAGGVQATATCTVFVYSNPITSAGSGYTVGDVLTAVGGTGTAYAHTVASVNGSGGVTAIGTITNYGNYSVVPTNPVAFTGGTGSGFTSNMTWTVGTTFTITNAGSGYVEQPTVTFSGGGGSGAAAFAVVGSQSIIKGIGTSGGTITNQSIMFQTPSGNTLLLRDSNQGTPDAHLMTQATANGYAIVMAEGSNANASLYVGAKGSGSVRFNTNSTSLTEQMRVSHTASAVNYVQVTGAATGGAPAISVQGSDANITAFYQTKGVGSHVFGTRGTTQQFRVTDTGSAVNYATVTGAIAGAAPKFSVDGSDTNIPLVLQPKGTGALQAQQTDSTATGGNARGANAVDWQTNRSSASAVASSQYGTIVGGTSNTASGFGGSVLGGAFNTSSNTYAVANAGNANTASGGYSAILGGNSNTSAGYYNFVGGGFTNSGTANGTVTTQSGTMNGTTAVTLSGSNSSIKVGQYITGTSIAGDTYVAAISGTSLTLSKVASGSGTATLSFYTPHGVVVGGGNNQATGSYSFIGGGGDAGTAANRNVASGDWSTVSGGVQNQATGLGSVVAGGGIYSTSVNGNTASGTSASILGGAIHSASGNYSSIIGGLYNSASGQYSAVGGANATSRGLLGIFSFSAGRLGTNGDAQFSLFTLSKQTTDATASVLTSGAGAASTTNQVILPNNSAYYFKGTVVAGVTGGGNTKGWTVEGVIKRGANAASTAIVGTATVTSSYADAGAVTWTIAATADTTNGGLAITFTGQAATTIRVVAKLESTEMTF